MTKRLLLPILFLFSCQFMWAASGMVVAVSDVQFSPPRYYVGDSVHLTFHFEANPQAKIVTPVYLDNEILKVDQVTVERTGRDVYVNVVLRFFIPGTRSVQFDFGDISTVSIPLHVSSVLENNQKDLYMSYGPLMLSGTRLMGTFLVALVILLPSMIYFLVKYIKKIVSHSASLVSPYNILQRRLKSLSFDRKNLSDKGFYTQLIDGLRLFLANFLHIDEFKSATAERMKTLLGEYYSEEETEEIMTIVVRGDMVKFGGQVMDENERLYCVKRILQLGKQLGHPERVQV